MRPLTRAMLFTRKTGTMKNILFIFCILFGWNSVASAQLNKTSFTAEANALGTAIDNKSLKEQLSAIDMMEKMANDEINYCRTHASATSDANVTASKQILAYLSGLPTNRIITDKKTTVDQLKLLLAKIQ